MTDQRETDSAADPRGVFTLAVRAIRKADRKAGRTTEAKYSEESLPARRSG